MWRSGPIFLGSRFKIEPRKRQRGMSLGGAVLGLLALSSLSACVVLSTVSFPNFPRWILLRGLCHIRSGWGAVSATGVLDKWRAGAKRAYCAAQATEGFRNDSRWRRRTLEAHPTKPIRNSPSGRFAWRRRLPDLEGRATFAGCGTACAIYTDAADSRRWGATLGERSFRGSRNKVAMREGINREELWVIGESRRV